MSLAQRYLSSFQGLSREVWTLSIVGLVNRMGMMVLPYLVIYLTGEMGYSASSAGRVMGVYGLGTLTGIYLGGHLTDRIGHLSVQLGSLLASGLLLIVMGQVQAGPGLVITIFFFGLTSDAYRPANMAAIAHHSSAAERTRAYGLYRLAINLGWSVGPAIGGFLALVDFNFLFWIDGITTLAAGAYLILALPSDRPDPGAAISEAPTLETTTGKQSPWRDRHFMAALLLLLMQSLIFFQLSSTFPLYLAEQRALGTHLIGCLMLVNTLLIVLFEMPLIARIDRFPKLRSMAIASLFFGAGFGFMPWASSLPLIALGMVFWTLGEMLGMPMMSSWVSARASAHNRGRYMAAFGMCFSVGQILAPILGTWTYEHLGPNWPWYGSIALGALSWLGFRALQRSVR